MKNKLLDFQTEPSLQSKEIEAFIRVSLKKLKRKGAAIGLSGGLDSAVTAMLTIRSLGKERVHLVNMPERDSNPFHRNDARKLADFLEMPLEVINITPTLRAAKTYRILPIGAIPGRKLRTRLVDYGRKNLIRHNDERIFIDRLEPEENTWMARGNAYGMAKHRIRMVTLYQYAEVNNLMVIGAANRTEFLTGTFCKWGIDQCADIMPVMHLFRTQLEQIADYIQVPDFIRAKPSDPDLYPTRINKGAFLGEFGVADTILYNLENNISRDDLYNVYDKKVVDYLYALYESSRPMRAAPYHL
jgi:NAD+ synthase